MNIIKDKLLEIKNRPFRPKKWTDVVLENLENKKTPFSMSTVRKVWDGNFYNEIVAIEIISVFEKEKRRQAKKLKKIIQ